MKADPGPTNKLSFYFAKGNLPSRLDTEPITRTIAGRPGAAEPVTHLTYHIAPDSGEPEVMIEQHGWFHRQLDLNLRTAMELRDFLNEWLPTDWTDP